MPEALKPLRKHIVSNNPSPHHSRHVSEPLDLEESLLMEIRKVRGDMAGIYRTEKLLAGAQIVELSRVKTFKAGLKNVREAM